MLYIRLKMRNNVRMNNADRIIDLLKNKDRRTSLVFNNELWELFLKSCEMENIKPTQQMEKFIIKFIEEKGLL